MHTIASCGLVLSTFGLAVSNVVDAATSNGIITGGQTLSQLGVPALLGVIACASVWGLVKVFLIYKEAVDTNTMALNNLIRANTEAITRLTSSVDQQNKAVERLDNVVAGCPSRK